MLAAAQSLPQAWEGLAGLLQALGEQLVAREHRVPGVGSVDVCKTVSRSFTHTLTVAALQT